MDADPRLGESSAATADKPGTPAPWAFKAIAITFLLLYQCLAVWRFAGHWSENLGARLDGSSTVPVWVSVAAVALVVGIVIVQVVLFARRRRNPVHVALAGMVLTQLAVLCESRLDF